MRIDKTGQQNAPPGVDHRGLRFDQGLDLSPLTGFHDQPVAD
jgi:hypothetical protein